MSIIYDKYPIIVGVDPRGVATVIKHPNNGRAAAVEAEVKLTTVTTAVETFTTEPKDTGLLGPVPQSRSATIAEGNARGLRAAIDQATIRLLLTEAANTAGQWVEISGTKVDGSRFERKVRPLSVQSRGCISTDYLYCVVAGGGTRTYRLDGITRAEFIETVTTR